jgi:hypothetical protein
LTKYKSIAIISVFAGEVAEWLKATDCKSVLYEYTGSNPVFPTSKPNKKVNAGVVQW